MKRVIFPDGLWPLLIWPILIVAFVARWLEMILLFNVLLLLLGISFLIYAVLFVFNIRNTAVHAVERESSALQKIGKGPYDNATFESRRRSLKIVWIVVGLVGGTLMIINGLRGILQNQPIWW